MKTKILILTLIGLAINIQTFAQIKDASKINQFNEKGQKDGFWVDTVSNYEYYQSYYKDGILSGIHKEYNIDGILQVLGEFKDGEFSGTWYYFENDGRIWMIFRDFEKNDYPISDYDGKTYIPDYKCYLTGYHPNGRIESEGIVLWSGDDNPVSDTSIEYGEWKYYDEQGNLIKTKIFK